MNAVVETQYVIRPMTRADVALIEKIEKQTYPYPWSGGIFRDCLQAGYCCEVVACRGGILGYAVMSLGAREGHILNLCVAPEGRGQGLGRKLLDHLIRSARGEADMLFLEVRPSNKRARRLYDQAGFNQIGVRPDYYPHQQGREDALILAFDISVSQSLKAVT
ncbi:MAG: ribosomal protein S18-alanine N-acetyltransferase [Gammaproteobacteria bacterium]|nr:ribosomal protein S18-alanine N-acetyltransferase [Gammaproteobacteria bacterium]